MASIYRRRGGWRAYVRRQGHTRSKDFNRYDDAVRWARKVEAELDRRAEDTPVLPSKRRRVPTLAEALDRYAVEVVPVLKGHKQALLRVKAWKRDRVAQVSLDRITSMDLAAWRIGGRGRPRPLSTTPSR